MYKNNLSKTRIYNVWVSMKKRCYKKYHKSYKDYGGRGITVCDEWLDKENGLRNFYNWAMQSGYDETAPKGKCTLDRIDNNKGYCPENCRWITMKEQSNNRRSTLYVEYKGETKSLADWCAELKLNYPAIHYRIQHGMSVEDSFSKAINHYEEKAITYKNVTKSLKEWCKDLGISYNTAFTRLYYLGWSAEKLIETPPLPKGKQPKYIEYRGETKTIEQWCKQLGLSLTSVYSRLHRGWSIEKTFSTPKLR